MWRSVNYSERGIVRSGIIYCSAGLNKGAGVNYGAME